MKKREKKDQRDKNEHIISDFWDKTKQSNIYVYNWTPRSREEDGGTEKKVNK